jgi:hypothetical protein
MVASVQFSKRFKPNLLERAVAVYAPVERQPYLSRLRGFVVLSRDYHG